MQYSIFLLDLKTLGNICSYGNATGCQENVLERAVTMHHDYVIELQTPWEWLNLTQCLLKNIMLGMPLYS